MTYAPYRPSILGISNNNISMYTNGSQEQDDADPNQTAFVVIRFTGSDNWKNLISRSTNSPSGLSSRVSTRRQSFVFVDVLSSSVKGSREHERTFFNWIEISSHLAVTASRPLEHVCSHRNNQLISIWWLQIEQRELNTTKPNKLELSGLMDI